MRTVSLAAALSLVSVVVAGPAFADSTTVRATTARAGVARGFAVASRGFAGDLRVEVLESDPGAGTPELSVGLSDGHTYWTATQALDQVRSDCGAGKCVTAAITRESIDVADGIAWVRFEVVNEVDHNDPDASDHDFTTHTTAVMGCTLPHDGVAPRCAWYRPGVAQSSHLAITGTTLTVTSTTGAVDTVQLSFDAPARARTDATATAST
jgi:hypothetical protein